jgi:hypothetical protein
MASEAKPSTLAPSAAACGMAAPFVRDAKPTHRGELDGFASLAMTVTSTHPRP